MKSVAKLIKLIILIVVILVVIVIAGFYLFGEHAIKVGIETAGTKALNVGVSVDDLDLSVLGGTVEIKGLAVNNPVGYEHEKLLELGSGRVQTSIGNLMGDPVKIKSIKLDDVNLTIEQKGLSNNLRDVIKSIPSEESSGQEQAKQGKELHVDELEISNVQVNVKLLPVPGQADTIPLKLDPIKMSNLGTDEKIDMAKLTTKIMLALATGIARQGAGIIPDDILKSINASLDDVVNIGKAAVKEGEKILDVGKAKGEEIIDTGKDVVEGIKGIFKKD